MRWRWLDHLIVPSLAALLEAFWVATAVAALSHWPLGPVLLVAFTGIELGAGVGVFAQLSRRVDEAQPPLLLMAIGAVAVIILVLTAPRTAALLGLYVGLGLAAAGLLVTLGLRIGRDQILPEDVPRRAERAFAVTFVVLLGAHAAGRSPAGAGAVVTAIIVATVLLMVASRLAAASAVATSARTKWYWMGLVAACLVVVLLIASALGGALSGGTVAGPLGSALRGLSLALAGLAYAAAWVVGVILAGIGALFHLIFGSGGASSTAPAPSSSPSPLTPLVAVKHGAVGMIILGIALGVAVVAGLLVLALRIKPRARVEEPIEERESVLSMREALRAGAQRVRGAVRRVARLREAQPRHAPEALRYEYRRLERALGLLGEPRAPGSSARRYLEDAARRQGAETAAGRGDGGAAAGGSPPAAPAVASELAGIYELARYSQHAAGWGEVERFKAAAAGLLAALRAAPPVVSLVAGRENAEPLGPRRGAEPPVEGGDLEGR